jgi:hypothetical protein
MLTHHDIADMHLRVITGAGGTGRGVNTVSHSQAAVTVHTSELCPCQPWAGFRLLAYEHTYHVKRQVYPFTGEKTEAQR